jgi:hypothetical protein
MARLAFSEHGGTFSETAILTDMACGCKAVLEYRCSKVEEQSKRFEKGRKKGNGARNKKEKKNDERMKSQGRQTEETLDSRETKEKWQIEKSTPIPDSIEESRGDEARRDETRREGEQE